MSRAKVVAVIGSDEDPFGVPVIEDGRRSCGRETWSQRMLYGAGVHTAGIAKPGADEIEIVDAVVKNLEPRAVARKVHRCHGV